MPFQPARSACTLALAAALTLGWPVVAQALTEPTPVVAAISAFQVEQVQRLWPGTVLVFSLDGSPGAAVALTITGAAARVPMVEVRPGHYEGRHTIQQADRLTPDSVVTASVARYGQMSSLRLNRSLVQGEPDPAAPYGPQITGYQVSAPDRVRPGDELRFSVTGTPGGSARVAVQGVSQRIPLTEVRRGVYEGDYVLRRQDKLRGALVADATLVSDRRETTLRLEHRPVHGATPVAAVPVCANCGGIVSVTQVEVKGDSPNVLGTIAGGLLGGVLGHQVGGGSGQRLATVLGAVGGAYAGNRIENSRDTHTVFRVAVRLDNGTDQSFDYADDPAVQIGTRVKVENGALIRL